MILSAETLEVLTYLKAAPGQYVAMHAISRRAAGRRKFEETPGWAKGLMAPLVEAGLVEVNERGHYRLKGGQPPAATRNQATPQAPQPPKKIHRKIVGDDYFPAPEQTVGDNYFGSGSGE